MSRRWNNLRKLCVEKGVSETAQFLFGRALRMVTTGKLEPPNTIEANLELWSRYDWSRHGEEWSRGEEWRQSVVEHVLTPNVPHDSRVLEIGPGAGRWTDYLVRRAAKLTLVDLTPQCIHLCQERFKAYRHIDYHVNDGKDLSFVPRKSVDRVWSFDVFVHISSRDIEDYIAQLPQILIPGGRAIIHHAARGAESAGWRSDMTAESMKSICQQHGFIVKKQFDRWNGDLDGFGGTGNDMVTIFELAPAH